MKLRSNIQLTVIGSGSNSACSNSAGLLQCAMSPGPAASIIVDALGYNKLLGADSDVLIAIPQEWNIETIISNPEMIRYKENTGICLDDHQKPDQDSYLIISNGRFVTRVNDALLDKLLSVTAEDVLLIDVKPVLLASREKIRLTHTGNVVGFRRLYSESVEPGIVPSDWPHHIIVKGNISDRLFTGNALPSCFSDFMKMCSRNQLNFRAVSIGGHVLDLESDEGLLSLFKSSLNSLNDHNSLKGGPDLYCGRSDNNGMISESARVFGKVLMGSNVEIKENAVIVGPAVIGNNVKIAKGAIINSSVIGPNISIFQNKYVNNEVIIDQDRFADKQSKDARGSKRNLRLGHNNQSSHDKLFCTWPKFSYSQFLKRFADIIGAAMVMVLFAPIVPFVALALKINSPGPLFFKAKRQGLYGKEFYCIKFRTMVIGADKMQDQLRVINQMDGPQFKIDDDPRVSVVGRFLRDTFIDEIPQFFNVLCGQMSIVGPRPSPESENTLCPPWRDARLSVRPGITGLWQACRTRQPSQDFQEWIHYDIKYVKNLSLKLDIWICWETAKQMFSRFISQF